MSRYELIAWLMQKPCVDSQIGLVFWCWWLANRITAGVVMDSEVAIAIDKVQEDGSGLESVGKWIADFNWM
jgi:hypothetical protein